MRSLLWIPLLVLFGAGSVSAGPIGIDVISASFNTEVSVGYVDIPTHTFVSTSRTTYGELPLSDALRISDLVDTSKDWGATADAGLLATSVTTSAYNPFESAALAFNGRARASASTSVLFTPFESAEAALGLSFNLRDDALYYTQTEFSLFDVTLGQTLWSYSGLVGANSNVPWVGPPSDLTAFIPVPTFLSASNTYLLTLQISTTANYDTELASISVSGLRQVPEPTSLTLMGAGLVCAGCARWRRRHKRPRFE